MHLARMDDDWTSGLIYLHVAEDSVKGTRRSSFQVLSRIFAETLCIYSFCMMFCYWFSSIIH